VGTTLSYSSARAGCSSSKGAARTVPNQGAGVFGPSFRMQSQTD